MPPDPAPSQSATKRNCTLTCSLLDGSAVKLDKKTPKLFGAEGEEAEKGLETKDEGISLPLIKGKVDLRRAEILILENIRSNETNALIGYVSFLLVLSWTH